MKRSGLQQRQLDVAVTAITHCEPHKRARILTNLVDGVLGLERSSLIERVEAMRGLEPIAQAVAIDELLASLRSRGV